MPQILVSPAYDPSTLGTLDNPQYAASPLDQRHAINVVDDDATIPRYYFTPRYSTTSTYQPDSPSPRSCDVPVPKTRLFDVTRPSPQPSPHPLDPSSTQGSRRRVSRADSDFDSLYDMTDDEDTEVPLHASASVKQVSTSNRSSRNRYPSLVIPSPSAWPTIEKLKSAMSPVPTTPSQMLTPSRKGMSALASHNLNVPGLAAPSLDGSLTSEEMDKLSCPSTPETQKRQSSSSLNDWSPVQLDFQAMETLQHLGQGSEPVHERQESQVIEAGGGEMQEVSRPYLGLRIPSMVIPNNSSGNTPVSDLSVPSPGGFFSSLHATARHTWSIPKREDSVPNTSTAENFYQLPWESRRNTVAESVPPVPDMPNLSQQQNVTLAGSTLDGYDDGLPTSRPVPLGDDEAALEIKEIDPSKSMFQYNDKYSAVSTVNFEMTRHWLEEQDELQSALRDMSNLTSPSLTNGTHSRGNSTEKASIKKSVKFAEEPVKSPKEEEEPKKIMTYIQGFEYLRQRSRKTDPYIHRQTRAEAMHVDRRCNPKSHRDQLLGKFELTNPVRPSPPRPVSEFYVDDPTVLKERIARAQMERQALHQMLPNTWVLQALKQLNGGRLLSKPSARSILRTSAPRILDVGGVPTNDWAWQVAYDYPYSTVTTVYTAGNNLSDNISGPQNFKQTVVPNLWTLPFPSGHFDVVSARRMYELLKTDKPLGRSKDEYDLCLKECFRCLKPGGILEFSLIDADIVQAGRQAQAMGVEFGFNLKTRGYDAAPTKTFISRLRKAGFHGVHRMWMVLPMGKVSSHWKDVLPVGAESAPQERSINADGEVEINDAPVYGTTENATMMTGMVGSWMWEKWILRLQLEMGKEDEKLLEGVVQVLEEGAGKASGWRYLTGYARK